MYRPHYEIFLFLLDSIAMVKLYVVKRLLDCNLLERHHKDHTFELRGVVKENVLAPTGETIFALCFECRYCYV